MLKSLIKSLAGLPDAKTFVMNCLTRVGASDLPDTPGVRRAVAITCFAVGEELLATDLISKDDLKDLAEMLKAWQTKR